MAVIKSFRAFRPTKELAARVAALPYDVMTSAEARKMVDGNPYSFLHIDRAEIDLDESISPYDPKVYKRAKSNLDNMTQDGVFIQDELPCLYIYALTMNGRTQTGLAVCTSVDEYLNGVIKKHELTREDKEIDRINHVAACNANTGPIFMTYRNKKEITGAIEDYTKKNQPEYNFTAEDGVTHSLWVINDEEVIAALTEMFAAVPSFYIADGHHRNASAAKVALKRRENADYQTGAESDFYLSVLFPDNELMIMDYNRVVRDLNGLTAEEFLNRLSESFEVREEGSAYKPQRKGEFGMFLDGRWYCIRVKEEIKLGQSNCSEQLDSAGAPDLILTLDVSVLQNLLLEPILAITDPRVDKRIDFVGGLRGLQELEKRVESGEMCVAFALYPTSMEELMSVADADLIMPPKSTWFEPKLRSGLLLHSLI